MFARLGREPFGHAPQVVAEMTIPQALALFRETDPKTIEQQSQREADDEKFFNGKKTIKFDTVADMLRWKAKQDAGL